MKKAKPQGRTLTILGQYAQVECAKCGKENGNWFTGIIGYADCECTLFHIGSKWRTEAKLSNYPITT